MKKRELLNVLIAGVSSYPNYKGLKFKKLSDAMQRAFDHKNLLSDLISIKHK